MKTEFEMKEEYNALLDEVYPEIKIGYSTFTASEILSKCDPIMYNESFLDFKDGLMEME
jgi:hypothetical protein